MTEVKTAPFNVVDYLNTPERVAAYVAETDAEMAELRAENARLRAQLADARREGVMSIVEPLEDLARAHAGRSPNRYDKVFAASVEQATIDARQYGYGADGSVMRKNVERLNRDIVRGWTDGVLSGWAAGMAEFDPRRANADPGVPVSLNNDHEQDGA
jgi:hypothetical protein